MATAEVLVISGVYRIYYVWCMQYYTNSLEAASIVIPLYKLQQKELKLFTLCHDTVLGSLQFYRAVSVLEVWK